MTICFDQDIELVFQRKKNTFIYIVQKDNTKKQN